MNRGKRETQFRDGSSNHGVPERRVTRARAVARRANITLGDLIAATFDTVGSEARMVARLISSADMAKAIGRRIVFT
jgi:hypothetical protein